MMVTLSVFYNIPSCDFKLFFLLRSSPLGGCLSPPGVGNQGSLHSARGNSSSAAAGSTSGQYQDPEKIRLQSKGGSKGPKYTQHLDEPEVSNLGNDSQTTCTSFLFPFFRAVPELCGPDLVRAKIHPHPSRRMFLLLRRVFRTGEQRPPEEAVEPNPGYTERRKWIKKMKTSQNHCGPIKSSFMSHCCVYFMQS